MTIEIIAAAAGIICAFAAIGGFITVATAFEEEYA